MTHCYMHVVIKKNDLYLINYQFVSYLKDNICIQNNSLNVCNTRFKNINFFEIGYLKYF